ncbi:MAG TPA: MFS transporter [Acidimicrobiales bacterium]|nr:MFS transporter [Acidimicrobiales bacterium]
MSLLKNPDNFPLTDAWERHRSAQAPGPHRAAVDGPAPTVAVFTRTRARQVLRAAPAWAPLAVCCLAQFMVVLDLSIVNVALPRMRMGLHMSTGALQWVVNAYTLSFAGLLMLGGRAADLFGRRRVFLLGVGLFTTFSLLGGLAQSGAWLITARALQGAAGAVLAPATLSLLTTTFPAPAERRRALGAWSATAASGGAVGVLAGGLLTNFLDWRWVLFVNVPVGVALLAGAVWALSESRANGVARRLDVPGAVSLTAAMSTLVYGIVSTSTHPWGSERTLLTLAIGAVLLGVFFFIEARLAPNPLVPLGIFRRRSLSAANGVAVTMGAALFSSFFFLSLYLQQVNGYSPLRAGLAFLPLALASLFAALSSARFVARLGVRRQLLIGLLMAAGGVVWLAQLAPGDGFWSSLFWPELLAGTGFGLSFVPMTLGATAGIPAHQAGLASGLLNTARQLGGAIGLAATTAVAAAVHPRSSGHYAVASALSSGYDRALDACAGVLVAGALVALLFPAQPKNTPAPASAGERPRFLAGKEEGRAALGSQPAFDLVPTRDGN